METGKIVILSILITVCVGLIFIVIRLFRKPTTTQVSVSTTPPVTTTAQVSATMPAPQAVASTPRTVYVSSSTSQGGNVFGMLMSIGSTVITIAVVLAILVGAFYGVVYVWKSLAHFLDGSPKQEMVILRGDMPVVVDLHGCNNWYFDVSSPTRIEYLNNRNEIVPVLVNGGWTYSYTGYHGVKVCVKTNYPVKAIQFTSVGQAFEGGESSFPISYW